MSRRALARLGTTLAVIALVASYASAGQREGSPAGEPGGRSPEPATPGQPAAPDGAYVIVNTPVGPIVVPRDMGPEIARRYGGNERDVYAPGAYQGQRHSNDSGGR